MGTLTFPPRGATAPSPVPRGAGRAAGTAGAAGGGPAPRSPPGTGSSRGSHTHAVSEAPRSACIEFRTEMALPEVHPCPLTFFLTARGCSVARITRSFCSAPPSIASTWTLGLLRGKKQKAGHHQSRAWQGGTDPGSVRGSTRSRHSKGRSGLIPEEQPPPAPTDCGSR